MKFLNKIKSNIYDPSYYSGLLNESFGSSIKYFFKLSFVLALLWAIGFGVLVFPKMYSSLGSIGEEIAKAYPSELEVKIKDGVVSTNVSEPYIVPVSGDYAESKYKNIVVIDTKSDFSIDKFESYNTAVMITKNALISKDKNDKITINQLKNVPDFTINHSKVVYWLNKAIPLIKSFSFAVPVLVFIGIFISYTFGLVYLLFAGLLVFILGKIRKLGLSYKKSYQISLHAVTLPFILSAVSVLINVRMFLFLPTIILLLVVLFNVKSSVSQTSTS